ncbi:MAG: hypothetical protein ABI298_06340 [Acidimicrobiales bacterium]
MTKKSSDDPRDSYEYQEEKYQDDEPPKAITPARAHAKHSTETVTSKKIARTTTMKRPMKFHEAPSVLITNLTARGALRRVGNVKNP